LPASDTPAAVGVANEDDISLGRSDGPFRYGNIVYQSDGGILHDDDPEAIFLEDLIYIDLDSMILPSVLSRNNPLWSSFRLLLSSNSISFGHHSKEES
jgi:hypothetical protein